MNYLNLLPNDVMKIINRKVQDLQIIKRRTERKEIKRIQRAKKRIADDKKRIYNKFAWLYQKHKYIEEKRENERIEKLEEEELKVYTKKINEQYEYLQKISKSINDKCGDYV